MLLLTTGKCPEKQFIIIPAILAFSGPGPARPASGSTRDLPTCELLSICWPGLCSAPALYICFCWCLLRLCLSKHHLSENSLSQVSHFQTGAAPSSPAGALTAEPAKQLTSHTNTSAQQQQCRLSLQTILIYSNIISLRLRFAFSAREHFVDGHGGRL